MISIITVISITINAYSMRQLEYTTRYDILLVPHLDLKRTNILAAASANLSIIIYKLSIDNPKISFSLFASQRARITMLIDTSVSLHPTARTQFGITTDETTVALHICIFFAFTSALNDKTDTSIASASAYLFSFHFNLISHRINIIYQKLRNHAYSPVSLLQMIFCVYLSFSR